MKNHRLPDKDEWDRIVKEAFSSDEIHTFSGEYNMKKYQNFQVRKGFTMKRNNLLMNLTVIATALAVVAVPTGLYVAGNMTATKSNTQYAQGEQAENEPASPVSDDKIYDIEYGWIPDYLKRNTNNETYFCTFDNVNSHINSNITVNFYKNTNGKEIEIESEAPIRDTYETEDKTIKVGYYDNYIENSTDTNHANDGRKASVCFKNSSYQLIVWATDDITKDDFRKFLENIKLVPTDTEKAWLYPETDTGEQAEEDNNVSISGHNIYDVEYGWLPEGMEYQPDDPDGRKFNDNDGKNRHLTPELIRVPSGDMSFVEEYLVTQNDINFTEKTTEYQTDDKDITIRYREDYEENTDNNNFGRVAIVHFKNTECVLILWCTDNITQDDLRKITENVKLVESDTGEQVTESEFTISDGNDDGQVNEGIQEFKETDSKPAENYDGTIYDVEYGWLPEGLEYQDEDSPYGGKFHNWITNDGMTPQFIKVPEGMTFYEDTGNPEIGNIKTEFPAYGKTVAIYVRDTYNPNNPELNFGRIAFIYFDNTPYVLTLYVTDGISEEDFRKIITDVKLVPSDTETASIYSGKPEQETIEFESGSYEDYGIKVNASEIVQIDEAVGEQFPDLVGNISTKIKSVSFGDNFNGLNTDCIGEPADFSQYLNEDGKLIENVREFYTTKNGKEETICSDDTTVSVMTVTITYTNNDDKPTADGGYCVFPTLQTIHDGYFYNPHFYNIIEKEAMLEETITDYKDNYYRIADCAGFSFSSPNQERRNEIHLDAGESAEVTLAFIVEDNLRDNLYLRLNDNGFVDLSNLK